MGLFRPCKLEMWQQITNSEGFGDGRSQLERLSIDSSSGNSLLKEVWVTESCFFSYIPNIHQIFFKPMNSHEQWTCHPASKPITSGVRNWSRARYLSSIIGLPMASSPAGFYNMAASLKPPDPATGRQLPSRAMQPSATPQGHQHSSLTGAK